ncbi:hypothetical protein GCM10007415_47120 [Parapedobacter pyrenivorans]|uniref:Uncharacterized protein n=1 Tax=Parapedobacter pyrenivorans TaxID=1305674 RepID=A0A917I3D2_9SPHI|nr:hypothetical protein [Parapedobacter pyrenivorans]GGH05324.1 hypothetical protein GCM10007415_47120 [Parapedobacter pyrenivorans]
MDQQTLIDRLPIVAKIKVPALISLGEDDTISATLLHDVCFYEKNDSIAFYAAYVLEHIASRYPERFMPVFDTFISRLPEQKNASCQRHFTKILMVIAHPKAPELYQEAYSQIERELLVETVFGWLIAPRTTVAVQANCMDILLYMSREFGWIREELKHQIEFLMRDGSAALQSRGKNVLEKLNRLKPEVDPEG